MDDKYEEWLRSEIVEMRKDVSEVRVTLARNTVSLETHMRRTDLLEQKVNSLWGRALSVAGVLMGIAVGVMKVLELAGR